MRDDIKQGEKIFLEGDIDEAERYFQNLISRNPQDVEALNNLGVIHYARGNGDAAERCFLEALRLDDTHGESLKNLAQLRREREKGAAGGAGAGRADSEAPDAGTYRFAFQEFDITPQVSARNGAALQGMGGAPRIAHDVSLPLAMQALLLEDGDYTRILVVTADLFGFGDEMVDALRAAAAEWGIQPEGLVLNASHTHYAPGTVSRVRQTLGPYYPDYAKFIVNTLASALPALYDRLEEAHIFSGQVETRIGVNRRLTQGESTVFAPNPAGCYERRTPFLVIRSKTGDQSVVLANHGCHPTSMGNDNRISADFPGYFRQALKDKGTARGVMFLQGFAGTAKGAIEENGALRFSERAEDAQRMGQSLAEALIQGLTRELRPVRGDFACVMEKTRLPLLDPPSRETLQAAANDPSADPFSKAWAQSVLAQQGTAEIPAFIELETQLIAIGSSVSLLTFPGEPAAGLAPRMLQEAPSGATFLMGYANGLVGYLPTNRMVEEGGYETKSSPFYYCLPAPFAGGVEEKLYGAVRESRRRLDQAQTGTVYGAYHRGQSGGKAFFTLSSGRCGTQTLTALLAPARNARVWHHPHPFLINETLLAYRGDIDKKTAFWRARKSIIAKSWAEGLIHGETDHNMTPFCDAIAGEIPDAKFIILVRNPMEFVRSGMRRNYYKGHPWDTGRLRPQPDTDEYRAWDRRDQFEKICWLWRETYSRILELTRNIGKERLLLVRFEDLVKDHEKTEELFYFLGLDGFDKNEVQRTLSRKLNAQTTGDFPKPDQWAPDLMKTLIDECGQVTDLLYPDWRKSYSGFFEEPGMGSAVDPHDSSGRKTVETIKARVRENQPAARPMNTGTDDSARHSNIPSFDYKNFKHQPYPASIDTSIFRNRKAEIPTITARTRITSMGSCFARNIALYLLSKGYNYIITEEPFRESSAHWDQVFNTACMRQIFEYTFLDDWKPLVRWWPRNGKAHDPFRRNILYDMETREADFEKHRQASRRALTESEIIIITLGLIETWRDRRDHMTYYRVPSPRIFDPEIHEFYLQTVDDCVSDLCAAHGFLERHNPKAHIFVTVSPVPLFASFRQDVDVVTANIFSKSTLRVAAEYFSTRYRNVHYFPSYEMVVQGLEKPYEEDNRHVTQEAVGQIMKVFESLYMQ